MRAEGGQERQNGEQRKMYNAIKTIKEKKEQKLMNVKKLQIKMYLSSNKISQAFE